MAKYVSGRVKDLKVGITSYSENLTSLTVVGKIALGGQTLGGGDAFTVNGNIGVGTETPTDPVGASNTSVLAAGIVTAYKYYGDGSNLTGIDATSLKDTDGTVRVQANTSGAVVTGIVTATSFSGALGSWTLGASGTDHYTFDGPGLTGAESDPTIYLQRGKKYNFVNASGGHPFRIQSTVNGSAGTAYNDGVTNNDAGNGTTLEWDVQFDAPNVLYYQCTSHGNMGGKIYIGNSGDSATIANVLFTKAASGIGATVGSAVGIVTYIGDGSSLTGIDATSLKDTNGDVKAQANTSGVVITGVTTASGVKISTGIVTATSGIATVYADVVIGSPTGGFKTGAFTINDTDKTKDSINNLNNILGKLVPSAPTTINGVSVSLTGLTGTGRLCAGFTPTNNTGGSAPSAGTVYSRNTDQTVSTTYLTEYGPGDSETVTGFVNAVGVGTRAMVTGNGNAGTYDQIQIANNEDASNSTRNPDIAAGFYSIYDVRLINAACPNGYNLVKITQGGSTTGSAYWYEDPSTVAAPIMTFGSMTLPASPTLAYSSGIPHYTQAAANNFTYVMGIENASGDMYTQNTFVTDDGATTGFADPGNKSYTDFGGTNPPAQNFAVGSAVTCLVTNTPNNVHQTVTSNIFPRYDVSTPYGSDNNNRIGFSTSINIMGTSATTSRMDEDNILVSSVGTGSGNATRVKAGATGDNPTPAYTAWTGGSAGSIDTYEAAVRGGVLYHDQTNYTTYLPAGPNYSSGRTGTQYFQISFIRSAVSEFRMTYAGSLAGCFVCMPDNSAWTTSLSGTSGWADMFQAYRGAGIPTGGEPGCATGGVMDTNGGTFTCTFGTESSSNDSNNRILIRWKLTSGQSITSMSFTST